MKKIIAIALLLAMCLCMFAGCNNTPAETVDAQAAVQKAADYVKSMYLEDTGEVTIDFTLVKAVSTNNGSYTVTWTVDNTEMVKIIDGTNSVTIDIENYPAEAYNFKLTATVADANGNTASIVLKYSVPKAAGTTASLENGTYVMAIDGKSFAALAETLNYGAVYPNDVVIEGGAATSFITTDVITVTNVEGGVTLQDCYGRYIYLKGDYNTFNVSKEAPAEGHVWNVLASDTGYILVNVLNGKTIAFDTGKGSYGANLELTEAHKTVLTVVAVNASDAAQPGAEYGVENKDKLVSIETAIDIATNIGPAGSTYKVYITGTVTEIASDVYGNMYITDGTNTLYVYGVYDADGTNRYDAMATKPEVGDYVVLYSIVSNYNGPQLKNAVLKSITKGQGAPETTAPATPDAPVALDAVKPVVGNAYGFAFVQKNVENKVLYITGVMDGYYMATTEDKLASANVFIEETAGGYHLYCVVGGAKYYINMVVNGTYVNAKFEETAATVYTYDETLKTVKADVNGTAYIFGTKADGTFKTIGPMKADSGCFYAQFITVDKK